MTGRSILAYDSHCGPCRSFRRIVGLLRLDGVSFMDLGDADRLGFLASVEPTGRYASFHLVELGRDARALRTWSGSEGLLHLAERLRLLGGAASLLGRSGPGERALELIYTAFSSLHGTCAAGFWEARRATGLAAARN